MKRSPAVWQLQDAKNRLSQVVDQAERIGPQIITRRGVEAAVVLSAEEYRRLTGTRDRIVELLRRAPKIPGGLRIERPLDTGRTVEL